MTKIVLVDNKGKRVGMGEKMEVHQVPVALHSAVSVMIFNKNKLLLQKRAKEKPTWGGYWSNTCCTHPYPGESYIKAAKRRLKEEMGISTNLKKAFNFIYHAKMENSNWGEHEYDWVFVGDYEKDCIKLNKDEVEDYRWIDINTLKKDVKSNPKLYTPWLKIILERF